MNRRKILFSLPLAALEPASAFAFDLKSWLSSGTAQAEVIVVGAGAAGLAAAVEAANAGASVIVLEKAQEIGGNTLISGGFYSAVDPVRQKVQGIEDSNQLFFEQTYKFGGCKADESLVHHLVDNAQSSLEWLEKLGMHFQPKVFELYGAHWPRSHIPVLPLGQGYIRTLSSAALHLGVRIVTQASVVKILRRKDRVYGVQAIVKDRLQTFKAKRGVVIASGGFASNAQLVEKYFPELAGLTTNNIGETTGEVMMAAHEIGADLRDMNYIQCLPGCIPGKKYRVRFHNDVSAFILINHEGNRFIREDATREDLRDAVLSLPQKYAYSLIDSQGFKKAGILVQKGAVLALEAGEAWRAPTIEDLAVKLKVNPGNLKRTVEDYNTGVQKGKDSFGKYISKLTLELKEPPFWASYAGMTIHYTEGGLRINDKAQCLDASGSPIPGLYAAGAVTGGVHGKNRLGGNGITDAIVFGRTAGISAARNSAE